jgi:glyoxylase I family protein
MTEVEQTRARLASSNVNRLHHKAYVTDDQEATRHFYEDLVGLPLVATWCEHENMRGKTRDYCHTFFALRDGGALAFFQLADAADKDLFRHRPQPMTLDHIALNVDEATQMAIRQRLVDDGYAKAEDIRITDHGYCISLYTTDPNGIVVEFARDTHSFDEMAEKRGVNAHSELKRWLSGDHAPNNILR